MKKLSAALVAASLFASFSAQAAVYTLITSPVPSPVAGPQAVQPFLQIEVSDAAVQRGTFSYSVKTGKGFHKAKGDVADFIGIRAMLERILPYSEGYHANLNALITFDSQGTVTGSQFKFVGTHNRFDWSGPASSFGGTYGGDNTGDACGWRGSLCHMVGQLVRTGAYTPHHPEPTDVPEPATLALLAVGLLGVAAARRGHPSL